MDGYYDVPGANFDSLKVSPLILLRDQEATITFSYTVVACANVALQSLICMLNVKMGGTSYREQSCSIYICCHVMM